MMNVLTTLSRSICAPPSVVPEVPPKPTCDKWDSAKVVFIHRCTAEEPYDEGMWPATCPPEEYRGVVLYCPGIMSIIDEHGALMVDLHRALGGRYDVVYLSRNGFAESQAPGTPLPDQAEFVRIIHGSASGHVRRVQAAMDTGYNAHSAAARTAREAGRPLATDSAASHCVADGPPAVIVLGYSQSGPEAMQALFAPPLRQHSDPTRPQVYLLAVAAVMFGIRFDGLGAAKFDFLRAYNCWRGVASKLFLPTLRKANKAVGVFIESRVLDKVMRSAALDMFVSEVCNGVLYARSQVLRNAVTGDAFTIEDCMKALSAQRRARYIVEQWDAFITDKNLSAIMSIAGEDRVTLVWGGEHDLRGMARFRTCAQIAVECEKLRNGD